MAQGTDDIASFFTKIKRVWDELNSLDTILVCTCGAAQIAFKKEQDQRLLQFLMGLNDDYNMIRGNILMMSLLPSVGQAYSLLIQEEKQREIRASSQFSSESASLQIDIHKNGNPNKAGTNKKPFDKSLVCSYCKKQGHTVDKCYRIHGFPANFKFTKGKRPTAAAVQGNDVGESLQTEAGTEQYGSTLVSPVPGFTMEQCNQFLDFINSKLHSQMPDTKPSSYSNMAGPFSEAAAGSW
ncbi:hypothetical protein Ancab_039938 [Ancistrocladus abbreviatus]